MATISKPREIRVQLDPDEGFPVAVFIESTRYIEEGGERIADLAPHVHSLSPDSPQVVAIFGRMASDATAALMMYQSEVQRLAGENADLKAQLQAQ